MSESASTTTPACAPSHNTQAPTRAADRSTVWSLRSLPSQLKSFGLTPLDYEDGKMVAMGLGAESPFPESAQHAINLRLLQIRDSPYLFDFIELLIELLRRGFDKRN